MRCAGGMQAGCAPEPKVQQGRTSTVGMTTCGQTPPAVAPKQTWLRSEGVWKWSTSPISTQPGGELVFVNEHSASALVPLSHSLEVPKWIDGVAQCKRRKGRSSAGGLLHQPHTDLIDSGEA